VCAMLRILSLVAFFALLTACRQTKQSSPRTAPMAAAPAAAAPTPVVVIPQPAPPQPAVPVTPPPAGAHYRVAKTDTAKSIAVRLYGDERYAEDILNLNKDAIRQARGLKPGMIITLPAARTRGTIVRP